MRKPDIELEDYFKQRLIFEKKVRKLFDNISRYFDLCSICFATNHSCCHPEECDIQLNQFMRKRGCGIENDSEYHNDDEYRKWVMENVKESEWRSKELHKGCPLNLGKSIICVTFSCNEMRDFFERLGSNWKPSKMVYKKISHLLHSINNVCITDRHMKRNIDIMKKICGRIDELFRKYDIRQLNEVNRIFPHKFGWEI